jgi:hypothetical protein
MIFYNETDAAVECLNTKSDRCDVHVVVSSDSYTCTGGCIRDGLSGDGIAGLIIGIVALVAIVVLCVVVFRRTESVRGLLASGNGDGDSSAPRIRIDQIETPPPGFGAPAFQPRDAASFESNRARPL